MFRQTIGNDSTTDVDTSGQIPGDGLDAQLKAIHEAKKAEASTFRGMARNT